MNRAPFSLLWSLEHVLQIVIVLSSSETVQNAARPDSRSRDQSSSCRWPLLRVMLHSLPVSSLSLTISIQIPPPQKRKKRRRPSPKIFASTQWVDVRLTGTHSRQIISTCYLTPVIPGNCHMEVKIKLWLPTQRALCLRLQRWAA